MSTPDATPASIAGRRLVFIHNPHSGRASARRGRRECIEAFVTRHGLDARVLETAGRGHATALARAAVADGAEVIVSVGGDGTMNEVATALVGSGVDYGLIPCGSGNGLARDLGLCLDLPGALGMLGRSVVRTIDTGRINGLPFFNVAGLGFDAEISQRFNRCPRRGLASYFRIGFQVRARYRGEPLVVRAQDGTEAEVWSYVTAIANSTQYGNNARIAPHARLDDGKLDLAVVQTGNLLRAVPMAVRLFAGTIDRASAVRSLQAPAFTIRRTKPGAIHTDGEVHECGATLEVAVVPRSLRVLVPRRA